MNRLVPILVAAVVLVGGAIYMLAPFGSSSETLPQLGAANAQEAAAEVVIEDMALGDAAAPVTIVEYASYTCPHCRRFHEGAFKDIKAEYIDTGKVHFIYREVYFDRPGLWASMIARCGGEARFFGISDLIYAGQGEWTNGDGTAIYDNLRRIGKTAGLSDAEMDACMADADKAGALYQWYQANAEADDVTSTPSFLINGQKYSNMSIEEFRTILDEQVGG